MGRPTVIVLTAVKNEEWIIRQFLQVMSCIADHIVIADQRSTDHTRSICQEFPKVTLIQNDCATFNEPERQSLLIETAREMFPGPRLLLTFDADDIPSANIIGDPEWEAVLHAPPGVPVLLQNVSLYGSPYEYRTNRADAWGVSYLPYGMIDNDAPHSGRLIHTPRLPYRRDVLPIRLRNVVSMHYQFVDVQRAMAKQRWYMCYEHLQFSEKTALEIASDYRWTIWDVHTWPSRVSPPEWLEGWQQRGIDLVDVARPKYSWWTWEVLQLFEKYGVARFADLPVWDYDWEAARKDGLLLGVSGLPDRSVRDPRSCRTRMRHYLWRTRGTHKRRHPELRQVLQQLLPRRIYASLRSAWHVLKRAKP